MMKNKKTIGITILSLALAAAVTAPAFADDSHQGEAGAQPVFPMKADVFQQHVEQSIARHKARLDQRIADEKLDDAKAKELRDKFDAKVATIRAAVATATQDGVVTKEEAQTVRAAEGWHHRHQADAQQHQ